ncbi:MAG: hypothetical protein ACREBE_18180 [bacterium]
MNETIGSVWPIIASIFSGKGSLTMALTAIRRGFPILLLGGATVLGAEALRAWIRGQSTFWTPTSIMLPIVIATYAGASQRYEQARTEAPVKDRLLSGLFYSAVGIAVAVLSGPWARWPPEIWDYGMIFVASMVTSWHSLGRRWELSNRPTGG